MAVLQGQMKSMCASGRSAAGKGCSGSTSPYNNRRKMTLRNRSGAIGTRAKLTGDNWLPGSIKPAYLDGTLPGDNGFDPLKLGEIESNLVRAREAELIHGRYAMLGAAGCLAVEVAGQGSWIDAPKWALEPSGFPTYLGVTIPLNLPTLILVEIGAMAYIETKRAESEDLETRLYPGGKFDPLGFAKEGTDAAKLLDLKEKELANGRLAMLAMLGFFAQADATKEGPLANLAKHLSDPWALNFATNGKSLPF